MKEVQFSKNSIIPTLTGILTLWGPKKHAHVFLTYYRHNHILMFHQ